MDGNLLVLVLEKECIKAALDAKRRHFRESGDESAYLIPPHLIIGRYGKDKFDRRYLHTTLEFEEEVQESPLGYLILPKENGDLDKFRHSLGLDGYHGIQISSKIKPGRISIPPSHIGRLALLKWEGEGYILVQ